LLTLNALAASEQTLIPLQCEHFAMRGIRLLLAAMELVKANHNQELDLGGILVTMYSTGVMESREVLDQVRAIFGNKVYNAIVYKSIRFAEASVANQSILEYAGKHQGAEAYRRLALEVAGSEGSVRPDPQPLSREP
jgi:chromosome partitioning protein